MAAFGNANKRSSLGTTVYTLKKKAHKAAFNSGTSIRASIPVPDNKDTTVGQPSPPISRVEKPALLDDITDCTSKPIVTELVLVAEVDEVQSTVPATLESATPAHKKKKKTINNKPVPTIDPTKELNDVCALFHEEVAENIITIGCDEAGRGPLIGPVVCAACFWVKGADTSHLGICDSKLVSKEQHRNELYEAMLSTPGLFYAIVELSPESIDRMNILNASLCGMSLATSAVLDLVNVYLGPTLKGIHKDNDELIMPIMPLVEGVEITTGITDGTTNLIEETYHSATLKRENDGEGADIKVAMLCDGDKIPPGTRPGDALEFDLIEVEKGQMPQTGWLVNQWDRRDFVIRAKGCVKGDATHRSIASASILAKVLRDQRMTDSVAETCQVSGQTWGTFIRVKEDRTNASFDHDENTFVAGSGYRLVDIYTIKDEDRASDPYGVIANKGYPTPAQKKNVASIGASIHHRLSFKPTLDSLISDSLKMPESLAPRAVRHLEELDRRAQMIENNKKAKTTLKKRARTMAAEQDPVEEADTSSTTMTKKTKLHMVRQTTLTSLFGGHRS